jgi:5'-nucleotidase
MNPPLLLLTNDDGIDSWFLEVVVHALVPHYEVAVVAPADEKSWIGRAVSRQGSIRVEKETRLPCPAWRVTGTPTDCINLAIGNLLHRKPDAVLSGINLGYNATVPLILSSGTVAGAIEGALHGIPSAAFSKQIPLDCFEEAKAHNGRSPQKLLNSLSVCAEWILRFVPRLLDPQYTPAFHVHNINFPFPTTVDTPVRGTHPVNMPMPSLFTSDDGENYHFRFPRIPVSPGIPQNGSDWECLHQHAISHSLLNLDFQAKSHLLSQP